MKRKRPKTMLSSCQVALYLSLNVQVQRDNQAAEMLTIPLLPLTILLLWGWRVETAIYPAARRVSNLAWAAEQYLRVGARLSVIGLKSVLYGLGAAG